MLKNNNTEKKQDLPIGLLYLDKSGNEKNLNINGKLWNDIDQKSKDLNIYKFRGFFNKTLLHDSKTFKGLSDNKKIKESNEIKDESKDEIKDTKIELKDTKIDNKNKFYLTNFFNSCQYLAIINLLALISGFFPYFKNSSGLIKIGPSKDLKKNSTFIDDSTVLDSDTNEIRISKGDELEPHRGLLLFESLNPLQQQDVIFKLHSMSCELSNILYLIKKNEYEKFDPIEILIKIANHCIENNLLSAINALSMEFHDESHILTQEERNNLFNDYDSLNNLWESGFITDYRGKFRIFIICMYFLNSIEKNKVLSK
jgi:hypothetical protein